MQYPGAKLTANLVWIFLVLSWAEISVLLVIIHEMLTDYSKEICFAEQSVW